MTKWFQEVILQKYWEERCGEDEYYVQDSRVLSARMNPHTDGYPDIIANRLRPPGGVESTVPAEVEWTTNDFRAHKHDVEELTDKSGFLIVYKRTQDFPAPQVVLNRDAVRDWLGERARTLFDETAATVERRATNRRGPRTWIVWRSHSLMKNFQIGMDHRIWGFPDNMNLNRLANAQAMKAGDIVVFVGPWRKRDGQTDVHGGRITPDQFEKGTLESIEAYALVSDYFEDGSLVWPSAGDERWRHRIRLSSVPVFHGESILTSRTRLGRDMTDTLRKAMVGRSDPQEVSQHLISSFLSAVGRR